MLTSHTALDILDQFEAHGKDMTIDDLSRAVGRPSTALRGLVDEMVRRGYLDPTGSSYRLGPGVLRLARLRQRHDPMITHAIPHLRQLIEATDLRLEAMLSRLYQDDVICIHQELGTRIQDWTQDLRGLRLPIMRGAPARVILAHLPDTQMKALYLAREDEFKTEGETLRWTALRRQFAAIRRDGFCMTAAEILDNRIGIAAPVFHGDAVCGSITLIVPQDLFPALEERIDLPDLVKRAAGDLTAEIAFAMGSNLRSTDQTLVAEPQN